MGNTSPPKNILVVGGTSFIGGHVLRQLAERPGYTVYSLGRRASAAETPAIAIQQDLAADPSVPAALQGVALDAIIHLAGSPGVWFGEQHPIADLQSNITSLLTTCAIARQCGAQHIVFASTCQVYHFDRPPGTVDPQSNYGIAKLAAEHYLQKFSRDTGIAHTILRISWIYGPGMKKNPLHDIVSARHDETLRLFIHPDSQIDFTHVDDLARAMVLAVEQSAWRNRIVDLGADTATPIRELIGQLEEIMQKRYTIECLTDRVISWHTAAGEAAALGWMPAITIHEGFAQTVAAAE